MTASEVADKIEMGLIRAGYKGEIRKIPMADGGEGTPSEINGLPVICSCDYLGMKNEELCNLPLLDRSSYRLGEVISDALKSENGVDNSGAPILYVAIGGTMTADGGAGLLQALGTKFYDAENHLITKPVTTRMLPYLSYIDTGNVEVEYILRKVAVIADVKASLTGPGLSALDFIKQKGAAGEDYEIISKGLTRLRRLCGERCSEIDGAGGGIGFALAAILGCNSYPGARIIMESADIPWNEVELVITGEGKIDKQTSGGKVVDTVYREARRHGIPAIAIGGFVDPELRSPEFISTIDDYRDYNPLKAPERLQEAVRSLIPRLILSLGNKGVFEAEEV